MTPETLFLQAWRQGVTLKVRGNEIYAEANSDPSPDLLRSLRAHKDTLMRLLKTWIYIPGYGEAKLHPDYLPGSFIDGRVGVVLRTQPDRVTLITWKEYYGEG